MPEEKVSKRIKRAIPKVAEPSTLHISPIEAFSNVIEYFLDEGRKDAETAALIGHLVMRRDYLIRQQNTLQGRPTTKGVTHSTHAQITLQHPMTIESGGQ